MRTFLFLIASVAFATVVPSASVWAQDGRVRGVVFADANANGARDAGERGVGGVAVSNQNDVVVTDSAGAFAIPPSATGIIFVSVPDGYRSVGGFWRATQSQAAAITFALAKETQSRTFTFAHGSDSHIEPANVNRFRRFRSLTDSLHASFVLMGGDLVRDAMSQQEPQARAYFDLFVAESKAFHVPLWTVPGNHDHFGIIRSRSHIDPRNPMYNRAMYRSYFGPDYYSFTYGGVHFIGLNSISVDDSAYYGNIDSVQMAWLKRDLEHVPASTPIVTFNHIPFVSGWWQVIGYLDDPLVSSVAIVNGVKSFRHTVGNLPQVLELMRGHQFVLGLGSHTHSAEHVNFVTDGMAARFDVSSAITAGNVAGPVVVPSGFTLYTVKNGVIDAGQFVRLDPPPPPR
ncbi:MAG TPA: metallophosphoesterase [Gemmatimonadaceae bacterium]|nr:metallophosphoesterase [Gemmatimonadaceae bacterium]